MRTVCLENRSQHVSAQELAGIGAALGLQLTRDFNTSPWVEHGYVPAAHLVVLPAGAAPPAGVFARLILLDTAGASGELGFHTDENGVAVGEVLVPEVVKDGASVCEVAGHELYELLVDPNDRSPWMVSNDGYRYPVEVCDAVQDCSYVLLGEKVPDFCWPRWFGLGQMRAAYSQRESVDGPFVLAPRGYISRAPVSDPEAWTQVFGQARTAVPAWSSRLARIAAASSATLR